MHVESTGLRTQDTAACNATFIEFSSAPRLRSLVVLGQAWCRHYKSDPRQYTMVAQAKQRRLGEPHKVGVEHRDGEETPAGWGPPMPAWHCTTTAAATTGGSCDCTMEEHHNIFHLEQGEWVDEGERAHVPHSLVLPPTASLSQAVVPLPSCLAQALPPSLPTDWSCLLGQPPNTGSG
ncbi:hypothetical protein O3P69_012931 [Scylla paramamosain]|uniref:Uncharacterized protein n=1 Tax=Scylla paramamosain TaxID=85552 RepID=A0AAW0TRC1_SCYPA